MSKEPRTRRSARLAPAGKAAGASREEHLESMLAQVESVRLAQRQEGNFDCFGRAGSGYCDQGGCVHRDDCLRISVRMN